MYKLKKTQSCGEEIIFFLIILCATLLLASVFYTFAVIFSSNEFYNNNMTSGSDDLTYYIDAINSSQKYSFLDMGDVLENIYGYSGHAIGYPILLFFIFSFLPFLHFGLLVNIFFYAYSIVYIAISDNWINRKNRYRRGLIFLALTPGIMLTSMHLFKDTILFTLTIYSLFSLQKGLIRRGIVVALLTHFLRPYNFGIILLPFLLIKFPRSSIMFLMGTLFLYLADVAFIVDSVDYLAKGIEFNQAIALRDLDSSNSNFQPSDSIIGNFLLGMIRFLFLPLPWVYSPGGMEAVFYFMSYIQCLISWIGLALILFYPKKAFLFFKRNYYLFIYAIFHAAVYSIIYFGNANFRYRVYLFTVTAMFIIEVIYCSKPRIFNLKTIATSRVKYEPSK